MYFPPPFDALLLISPSLRHLTIGKSSFQSLWVKKTGVGGAYNWRSSGVLFDSWSAGWRIVGSTRVWSQGKGQLACMQDEEGWPGWAPWEWNYQMPPQPREFCAMDGDDGYSAGFQNGFQYECWLFCLPLVNEMKVKTMKTGCDSLFLLYQTVVFF